MKLETRQRLLHSIDKKYVALRELKADHESEIEPLSRKIDLLQEQLEEAMKARLAMITRQVREIKAYEDEIRQIKRKLENFDRYASTGNLAAGGNARLTHWVECRTPNYLTVLFNQY